MNKVKFSENICEVTYYYLSPEERCYKFECSQSNKKNANKKLSAPRTGSGEIILYKPRFIYEDVIFIVDPTQRYV
jgi:hypothetical protein